MFVGGYSSPSCVGSPFACELLSLRADVSRLLPLIFALTFMATGTASLAAQRQTPSADARDVMQRSTPMRVNRFVRASFATALLTMALVGCASAPQARRLGANQASMKKPVPEWVSAPTRRRPSSDSLGSLLRQVSHVVAGGLSWLFPPPAGVYGPPESVAYSGAKTWKIATGALGCTSKCSKVNRNSVRPVK